MAISQSFLDSISTVFFSTATDIDDYFIKTGGQDFVSWFNAHIAGRDNWGKVGVRSALEIATDSLAHERFNQLWSNESLQAIFGTAKITLLQFLALQSIIINETGGSLVPLTEGVGSMGHPGIAYAFDSIPGLKRSYNTLVSNKTCFQNFNDSSYNMEFGKLPLADKLVNTTDKVWEGQVYPQEMYPTSTNALLTGYILEADFFKFRGRGFIQTTGRANYIPLISYIMNYSGDNSYLLEVKMQWNHKAGNEDMLASMSSNADWDNLFQRSDCLIAGRAIYIHNELCNKYLQELDEANQEILAKSLYNMGLSISGGEEYAILFQNRVIQIMNTL